MPMGNERNSICGGSLSHMPHNVVSGLFLSFQFYFILLFILLWLQLSICKEFLSVWRISLSISVFLHLVLGFFPSACFVLLQCVSFCFMLLHFILLSFKRLFSNAIQKGSESWWEGRWGETESSRVRGNSNQYILCEKIYFQ